MSSFVTGPMLAVAVIIPHASSPPPAPTPPSTGQNECKYSAMVNDDRYHPIYQCYTQAEWDQRNADIAAHQAEIDRENQKMAEDLDRWWAAYWWTLPTTVVSIIALAFVHKRIKKRIDIKRHPYKYDDNGNLKFPWN